MNISSSLTCKPLVIGHRGAAGEAPENTLASFQHALEEGADALELDVHLSRDGKLIVCHDASVNRTTNGLGWIRQMTSDELRALDAGGWHSPQFTGEPIPLLEDVFREIPEKVLINVEVKHSYERQIEPVLVDLLRRTGRMDDVIVSSFDHKSLVYLKSLAPEVKLGLLYGENLVNPVAVARLTGVPIHSLHPYFGFITREDVDAASRAGLNVYPYTANEESDYRRLVHAGVSGIITDFPGRLRSLLDIWFDGPTTGNQSGKAGEK